MEDQNTTNTAPEQKMTFKAEPETYLQLMSLHGYYDRMQDFGQDHHMQSKIQG